MQSVTLHSHSGKNGILTLEVPVGIADADWDVVVVVQPAASSEAEKMPEGLGWPAGFFEKVIGGWQGEPLVREEQGEFEVRDEIR